MTVKWECMNCGHVWDGVPSTERSRRATCRRCGSWQVYPGWKDRKWSQVSAIVKSMRGHRCERCGATDKLLNVHHIVSLRAGGDSRLDNLVVLCAECHAKEHFGPVLLLLLLLAAAALLYWLLSRLPR